MTHAESPLRTMLAICLVMLAAAAGVRAQFDETKYQEFLKANKGMTADLLLQQYPAGMFNESANLSVADAQFFSVIDAKMQFTARERELASKHGFMVTERKSYPTFQAAYLDAYINDLPVYISADAILHALHRSYDNMLEDLESTILIPALDDALTRMHNGVGRLEIPSDSTALRAVHDADVYLTVALSLLRGQQVQPRYAVNGERVSELMMAVMMEQMQNILLFGETPRDYDFSQLKPRGHYTRSIELEQYFRAMMWLGRTEIYITKPTGVLPAPTDADILEQCMMSVVLATVAESNGALDGMNTVDALITKFVGEQDNLTLPRLIDIIGSLNVSSPETLNDPNKLKAFQQAALDAGAGQRILSQLLWDDPFAGEDDKITPAAAFMLLGQRFILDSYILAAVVHDKVDMRMMPSPLDAMFALGNDAAAQLLANDIRQYGYAVNLAGLRYLTESLPNNYWSSSLYATWLSGIRALNPEDDRSTLPKFMQTGAWWEKSLNTQLMSWAELRHDNILYAKQSYTGGVGCFYPDAYVEPEPDLYRAIASFATDMEDILTEVNDANPSQTIAAMLETLNHLEETCTLLASMAEKELVGGEFSQEEKDLIDNWIVKGVDDWICIKYDKYDGVYPHLMYGVDQRIGSMKPDFVIADVHTQPTDEVGNLVGKILHVSTGRINTALVLPDDPVDGCVTAYVGPVGSYYEVVRDNFERLTDEEWETLYTANAPARPSWVFTYLANDEGQASGEAVKLITGVDDDLDEAPSAGKLVALPNPTSQGATLVFAVPPSHSGDHVTIRITDMSGRTVAILMDQTLSTNNYQVRWDGTVNGAQVSPGSYAVTMTIGSQVTTTIMSVVR